MFNGAEETFLDASHGFATQYAHRDVIRIVINMDAMGQSGRDIMFQLNSPQLLKIYAQVPFPHGSAAVILL